MAVVAVDCQVCGRPFVAARSHARTCSHACRQQIYRDARREDPSERLRREVEDLFFRGQPPENQREAA